MALAGLAIQAVNERLSASLSKYQPNIANQVMRRKPAFEFFMNRKKLYSGGLEVAVRIRKSRSARLGQTGGVGAFSYYDLLSTSPTDTIKSMAEGWSYFNVPITLSHIEMYENDGENNFDRLKEATSNAEDDLSDDLNDVIWGISGGDGNKLPTPITDIISGSDAGTLYGLSKASNTYLYSQEVNSVGDLETELLDAMREGELKVIDNAPNKMEKIDFWITHRDVYLGIEKILPQYVQVTSTDKADLGFDQILFNKVPIRWDSDCPLDSDQKYQMFGGISKHWEVPVRKQMNFTVSKLFDRMPEQAASVSQLMTSIAFLCNNPRTTVRIKGIDL